MKCIIVSLDATHATRAATELFPALLEEFFSIQGVQAVDVTRVVDAYRGWIGSRPVAHLELSCVESSIEIDVATLDGQRDHLTVGGIDCLAMTAT